MRKINQPTRYRYRSDTDTTIDQDMKAFYTIQAKD